MKFTPLWTSVIPVLSFLPSAHAWGQEGHAIVATIAELHLGPTVLPTLCSILNLPDARAQPCSLASVASWADEIKSDKRWSGTAGLHFANAVADHPPQLCLFPGDEGWSGPKDANVLGGIRNTTNLLGQWVQQGSDLSDPVASESLKFLIHFLGDIHMPLHLTGRERGGNDVRVMWGIKEVRLHKMWDEEIVARAIETTPSEWDQPLSPEIERHLHGNEYDRLIRKILVEGIKRTWADKVESWTRCPAPSLPSSLGDDQIVLQPRWEVGDTDDGDVCPWHWASPLHELVCEWVWPKQLDEPPYNENLGPLLQLDTDEYAGKITREWVVEELFAKGGLRLAMILNFIFAPQQDY
ncbi:S1/P1 nuclease [Thelephora terrestris]|uniref:S1/P1 nuclease n=1 Tax=Thelephora terrestris TaxID=56493 RepID=A0A9P6L111_9AGAM|nr:S1/P1 nuclease [Thelephora terrestris]